LQWAFLPISAAQEFIYRAYFQLSCKKYQSSWAIIIVSFCIRASYTLGDPLILLMTFVAGLGWGYLWHKYPNFYLITLSHTVLNFIAVLFGFFPWLITAYFKI